jgi:Ni/Fe-hydrogenase subunit HybB-like protein
MMIAIPLTVIGIMPGFWILNQIMATPISGYDNPIYFTATAMIGIIALALIIVFVGTQLMAILFLMSENERIQEEAEKNFPPF